MGVGKATRNKPKIIRRRGKGLSSYEQLIVENTKTINEQTFREKEGLWFNNLAENLTSIRGGHDLLDLPKHDGQPALVVGAGPSAYEQLPVIADLAKGFKGVIVACDKILRDLLEKGVEPLYVLSVDGDPQVAKFFTDLPPSPTTSAVMNGFTIHPDTVKACPYPIYWYTSIIDNPYEAKSLTRAIQWMTKKTMLPSLGNVGGTAWNVSLNLNCDPVGLVGLDYGYPPDNRLEETIYWRAYVQSFGEKLARENCYRVLTNPETGRKYLSDLNWDVYRKILYDFSDRSHKAQTFNCSPRSSLSGHGIKYKALEEFMRYGQEI